MNDTPETDAEKFYSDHHGYYVVFAEHAEDLERERNEWKKVAEGSLLGAIKERDEAIQARKNSAIDWLNQVENADLRVTRIKRERDEAKDNVRKLAVSLADSIRFSLARQDETEQAVHECSELRILVDGLLEMNQKLSDERNSYYDELLTKRGLCKVQEQVIIDWKAEAEKWRAIANDNRN